jgi:hypothetical protein
MMQGRLHPPKHEFTQNPIFFIDAAPLFLKRAIALEAARLLADKTPSHELPTTLAFNMRVHGNKGEFHDYEGMLQLGGFGSE